MRTNFDLMVKYLSSGEQGQESTEETDSARRSSTRRRQKPRGLSGGEDAVGFGDQRGEVRSL